MIFQNESVERHNGPSDMKIFITHIIAMGLVKKNQLEKYLRQNVTIHTPFFGKYMSHNGFQRILSNLYLVDNNIQDHRSSGQN